MILRGVLLLARGRADGIAEFGNSDEALTASLAPLIAFPLVGAGITAMEGEPWLAVLGLLARLCAVLAVPVITYEFARVLAREGMWIRTAAALNWSFWLVLPLLLVAAVIGAMLVLAGLPMVRAEQAAIGVILGYLLWFHWFAVRAGLQVGRLQAAVLVLLNGGALTVLTLVPHLLAPAIP